MNVPRCELDEGDGQPSAFLDEVALRDILQDFDVPFDRGLEVLQDALAFLLAPLSVEPRVFCAPLVVLPECEADAEERGGECDRAVDGNLEGVDSDGDRPL